MENTLIMNKLPLPRYYDGQNWNTVFRPTRRSIPKYLHQDLPELKLQQLKERFKQIGKFNCPKLDYFNDYIRKHNTVKEKKSQTSRQIQDQKDYEKATEELQYAMLLCDRESPVLDQVIGKSRAVRKPHERREKQKSKHFDNTINLVFRNRKNMYLSLQKRKHDDHYSPNVEKAINEIPLLPYDH